MNEQIIALNGLTKSYGKHRGISDLSFSVNAGEIFGFIGPNGAGKSTTIRTLMGLIRPTGGSATIFGLDCQTQASEIARNVGYLPSEDSYYENMKVHQLLQYTADLYGMDCWSRVNDLAARLDLDLYRRISDLSLGNRKKVGIVSALITSPKLVIMDEPTSGLDPLIQQVFYEILAEENRRGTTIFLSSHVLSEVQRLCDRAAILKDGRLVGIQSIKELRESGYIIMAGDGNITLTASGMEIASRVYRRHKTITKLFELMGVSPEQAALDACKVEHDLSEETFARIHDFVKSRKA